MPKLVYHDSDGVDKTLQLGTDPIIVGRAADCQIQTHDAMVSRKHARISWEGNYWIEDLGSSNGVFLGAEKVSRAPFRPGDVVTCGSLVIRMMPDVRRASAEIDSLGPTRPRVPTPPSPMDTPADPMPAQSPELHPRLGDDEAPPVRREQPSREAPAREISAREVELPRDKPRPAAASSSRAMAAAAPAATTQDGGELSRLRADLRRESERREQAEAALLRAEEKVQGMDAAGRELVQLRRRVEQLETDLAEARDQPPPPAPGPALDLAEVGEAVAVFNDALAELKASVRSAVDEAELLTAPDNSVRIVRESMQSAMEQLEGARMRLREMIHKLGLRT